MEWRLKRQFKIFLLLGVPLAVIAFFIFRTIAPPASCFDNTFNQDEEQTDCGGAHCAPCKVIAPKDLELHWVRFLGVGQGRYDAVAELVNPNTDHAASKMDYTIEFFDASGNTLVKKNGSTFFLPGELKHIAELNVQLPKTPVTVVFQLNGTQWVKRGALNIPDPKVVVGNRQYLSPQHGQRPRAEGLLSNQSPYLYREISIVSLLLDAKGNVISVSKTLERDLVPGEARAIEVVWSSPFTGEVASLLMEPEVNVFDPQNITTKE